ncbi:hypothetical protein HK414_13185 [Ramlibacter terrae]|uniref:Uncharacterized protein n=1 Tax=Ramlibacter terrae TaxID=2732511 RepID=A0ABX6P4E9_9BURK|nr:hypothetical protein HK414_13185 [Ramlibacter terrae]
MAGVVAGLLLAMLARPRGGAPLLLDAVVEMLRTPLALFAIPLPALLLGAPGSWPALVGVATFTSTFLLTFEARRRGRP